jgi:arylamine N-acetyltransferase
MSENRNMDAVSGEVYWRDPEDQPPPRGVKLLILTSGGVAVFGDWMTDSNFVAWSPLPKKRQKMTQRVCNVPKESG